MNGKNLLKLTKEFVTKNSSVILASLAGVSAVSAVLLAIKDAPKVNQMMNEKTEEKGEDLTKKETAVVYVKGYWKTILLTTTTLLLIAGNTYIDGRKYAALGAAYALTDGKLKDLKSSIKETLGVEDQKKVEDKATEKAIEKNPYNRTYDEAEERFMPPAVIQDTKNNGLTLFWDDFTGHWFWSTREKIQDAANFCNKMLLKNEYVGLNEFYDQLGIETSLLSGMFGWHVDQCSYSDYNVIEPDLDSEWGDYTDPSRGGQYGILRFVTEPVYEYERYNR